MANDDITKAAAQYLLKNGLASIAEVTALCGRSRQIVRFWAKEYPNARTERLAKIWAKARLSADKNR